MEEAITPTVLWAWIVGCGIWAWNQQRQSRWNHRQLSLRQVRRVQPINWSLFGVLLVAIVVIDHAVLAGFTDSPLVTGHSGAGLTDS